MSQRFRGYLEKVSDFTKLVSRVRDRRASARVSTYSCFLFGFWMFALGSRGLNGFEARVRQASRRAAWRKAFQVEGSGASGPPSADTMGDCLARVELDDPRQVLHRIYTVPQRNHLLARFGIGGLRVLAVDGHEVFSSCRLRCPQCCERVVKTSRGAQAQ